MRTKTPTRLLFLVSIFDFHAVTSLTHSLFFRCDPPSRPSTLACPSPSPLLRPQAAAVAAALSAPRDLAFFSSPSPTNSSPPPTAYSSAASYWRSFTERHAKLADAIRALSSTTSQAEAAAAAPMLSKVPAGRVAGMWDFFPYLALAPQFNALVAPIVSVHGAGNAAVSQGQAQGQAQVRVRSKQS